MIYRFVFVESVTMGWKESVCSPYSNYERTEAHQVMAFQLERQLCLLHLTSLFHNLENHENHASKRRVLVVMPERRTDSQLCVSFSPFNLITKSCCILFLSTSSALSVKFAVAANLLGDM